MTRRQNLAGAAAASFALALGAVAVTVAATAREPNVGDRRR